MAETQTAGAASIAAGQNRVARNARQRQLLLLVLLILTLGLAAASLLVGSTSITLPDLGALFGTAPRTVDNIILIELRLPRTLLALLVGAALGGCGAALQGLLHNPLAEPGTLGVGNAAALGAVIVLYFGIGAADSLAMPIGGLLGAAAGIALVLTLGRGAALTLILAGVAVGSLATALISLALNFAPSPYAALEMIDWLLGSLADRSLEHVALLVPFMAVALVLMIGVGRDLDALTLGEDAAQSLGVRVGWLRMRIVIATAVAVGASTSITGSIAFIGLIVPHLLRPLVGYRPSALLPTSMLGGALLLLAADIGVRLLAQGIELKIGVLTALIGAPFFLHLVVRMRREAA